MCSPGYSVPLTTDFLKANDKLVLDTAFFSDEFKAKLMESIEDFDEQCDGLLVHSENFQALNLLQERYREQVKCVYLDPPYNTSASEILYKNSYKSSSWLSYVENRLTMGRLLLSKDGMHCTTIDDFEFHKLREVLNDIFGNENFAGVVSIKNNPSGRSTVKGFSIAHEYGIFHFASEKSKLGMIPRTEEQIAQYGEKDNSGQFQWRSFLRSGGSNDVRKARPKLHYPIKISGDNIVLPIMEWNEQLREWAVTENISNNDELFYPINNGIEYTWRLGVDTLKDRIKDLRTRLSSNGKRMFDIKFYLDEEGVLPKTIWDEKYVNATAYGTTLLRNIMGESQIFSFPKSLYAVVQSLRVLGANNSNITALDYFAGSGTTGHAVINLNREDNGKRKYILVEMGNHFDTVLKPRIKKVIYSSDWKNGNPTSLDTGISYCFKYIRLESYEDTLNNLVFDDNPVRGKTIESNPSLKEDYMLRYLLDVDTRGSQSLLNIDGFADPKAYSLKVKKPGGDEQVIQNTDLIETFNYLIGLRLENMAAPQTFTANFTRKPDPELPEDQHTKLVVDGRIQMADDGKWWFRKLEGWMPADPMNPNNGRKERVLIVWRKLTGNLEEDNLMLDEWFKKYRISTRDFEYDTIYVNGSNNLPNLKKADEDWKVRLIEEEFHKKMWEVGGEV
jgi:adenine-specific DNA-methyltransferase